MVRPLQLAGLTLACVAAWGADQKNAPKNPPSEAARPNAARNPGGAKALPGGGGRNVPGGGGRNMGPRLTNPANPVSHLYRAAPEERERALERFPQQQQEKMRTNLQWFDHLPKPQQEIVLHQAERYEALPPQRRQEFQQRMRDLQGLPQERRQAVGAALRRLQVMPDDERVKILNSDPFKARF